MERITPRCWSRWSIERHQTCTCRLYPHASHSDSGTTKLPMKDFDKLPCLHVAERISSLLPQHVAATVYGGGGVEGKRGEKIETRMPRQHVTRDASTSSPCFSLLATILPVVKSWRQAPPSTRPDDNDQRLCFWSLQHFLPAVNTARQRRPNRNRCDCLTVLLELASYSRLEIHLYCVPREDEIDTPPNRIRR